MSIRTHDTNNRPYAKLSQLKEGDQIELDIGFACHKAGITTLKRDKAGLYFTCTSGHHHISGQADDGEHLVGIYIPR